MLRDEHAASPLAVLSTTIAVAVLITAIVLLVFFNDPAPDVGLVFHEEGPDLEVTATAGGLAWEELTVQLVDRGGFDHTSLLALPAGPVEEGQRVGFERPPPAGTYRLVVLVEETEVERLVLSF